jgi:hypothetical protein
MSALRPLGFAGLDAIQNDLVIDPKYQPKLADQTHFVILS